MDTTSNITILIRKFENNEIDFDFLSEKITFFTGRTITKYEVENYWQAQSLEEFAKGLSIVPIKDWQDLNDDDSIVLLKEILANITNNPILDRNSEALEKRYSKVTGTIIDLIFYQDILDAKALLLKLKENTTINL